MKTNMSRILAMMLVVVMLLSMVGCGAKEEAPAAKESKTSINILMRACNRRWWCRRICSH